MNEIYKLTIFGTGFEICVGEIEKLKFEYWKDKEITSEIEDNEKKDKFNLFEHHWTDLNDIYHDNGPGMLENTKLEIKKDDRIILESYLGKDDLINSKINLSKNPRLIVDVNPISLL